VPPLDTSSTVQMRIDERQPNLLAGDATPLQAEGSAAVPPRPRNQEVTGGIAATAKGRESSPAAERTVDDVQTLEAVVGVVERFVTVAVRIPLGIPPLTSQILGRWQKKSCSAVSTAC
jgi:hypothetical protein